MRLSQIMAAILLTSCSTPTLQSEAMLRPQEYVGRQVSVCGTLDGANLLDQNSNGFGLAIIDFGDLGANRRGRVCITGEIVYIGCLSGNVICNDWAFDHGIRVSEVLSR